MASLALSAAIICSQIFRNMSSMNAVLTPDEWPIFDSAFSFHFWVLWWNSKKDSVQDIQLKIKIKGLEYCLNSKHLHEYFSKLSLWNIFYLEILSLDHLPLANVAVATSTSKEKLVLPVADVFPVIVAVPAVVVVAIKPAHTLNGRI